MIRTLAGRLLRALGLARAAHVNELSRRARLAERRVVKLERALVTARASVAREVERHDQFKEESRRTRDAMLAKMRALLADATRERLLADGHLALVETKLDVLEGAIQALDTRTRSVLIARAQPASSPQSS